MIFATTFSNKALVVMVVDEADEIGNQKSDNPQLLSVYIH
jgi:hypothetical protein